MAVSLAKEQLNPGAVNIFRARDRHGSKKTILIIDHYVPQYDKDAGGRCTCQYMALLVEIGLHVVFLGDNLYRHEPYTEELQQMGVEVLYGNWYRQFNEWIKDNGNYFNYVYLNRPHIAIKYIDAIRKYTSAKIIYFGHDLHYLRELRNYEIRKDKKLLESSNNWKMIEHELFGKADVIHVVGSSEQKIVQLLFTGKPVRNIPLYFYDQINPRLMNIREQQHLLFVGGFSHPPNEDAVLWLIKEIYPLIIKQIPEMKNICCWV